MTQVVTITKRFYIDFLQNQGFLLVLFFDLYNSNNYNKLKHIKAYKCLRQGLCAFEINKRYLKLLEKPLRSQD
jgi:hypothetical protein